MEKGDAGAAAGAAAVCCAELPNDKAAGEAPNEKGEAWGCCAATSAAGWAI